MPAFQKLNFWNISMPGSLSHCHSFYRGERMMTLIVFSKVQLQGCSAGSWDAKSQTQSDIWITHGLLKSEKIFHEIWHGGQVNILKWLFLPCQVDLISFIWYWLPVRTRMYVTVINSNYLFLCNQCLYLLLSKTSSIEDLRVRPLLSSLLWTEAELLISWGRTWAGGVLLCENIAVPPLHLWMITKLSFQTFFSTTENILFIIVTMSNSIWN